MKKMKTSLININMTIRVLLLIGFVSIRSVSAQSLDKFSSEELKSDLEYMYLTLQKTHYNLFINTTEKEYQVEYDNLSNSLNDSLNILDVYRKFQPFVSLSGLGHCSLEFPFNRVYGLHYQNGGKLFPLNIRIDNSKAFITGNYSGNDSIEIGAELISINNIDIKDILIDVYSYLSGEDEYYKNTLLDMVSFPRMLWILQETPKEYSINVRNSEGVENSFTIKSVLASEFESAFSKEKEMFDNDRIFQVIDNIAYIKPGPFINAEGEGDGNTSDVNTFENSEFVNFIDSTFSKIAKEGYDKLIIDLRNNGGGSNTFSDEMIAYIADKPFKFCSRFEVKTSQITKDFWEQVNDSSVSELKEQILSHKNGDTFVSKIPNQEPKADSLRFKGKVYVLINRYTYSQATITAAMIQDYSFGTLIGEKTADIPTTYGSVHQFELPNTKIAVTYPKAFMVRPSGDIEFKGTEPDIIVKPNIFSDKDEILDYAIEYIKKDN